LAAFLSHPAMAAGETSRRLALADIEGKEFDQ
jgi:hypothetical protein